MNPGETVTSQTPRRTLVLLLATAIVTPSLHAQDPAEEIEGRPALELALVSGGAAFSAFRGQRVQARLLDGGGERTFDRLIAPETSTVLSIHASWWPSARWGLRLAGSWAPSSMGIRLEERDRRFLERGGMLGESGRFADLSVWTGDVALLVGLPTLGSRLEPHLVLGGGVVVYDVDRKYGEPIPLGVRGSLESRQRAAQPAVVVGGGLRVPLRPGALALTFELLDHITLSPFDDREHAIVEREGIRMELDPHGAPHDTRRVINHLRFGAGIAITLR